MPDTSAGVSSDGKVPTVTQLDVAGLTVTLLNVRKFEGSVVNFEGLVAQLPFLSPEIGATSTWTPPFMESVTLSAISLPAGATLFLHTPGTAATE